MSSLSSLSSTSARPSIADPATDMPTVCIPLPEDGAAGGETRGARKGGALRWIATALFFAGGLSLLALLLIQLAGF